MDDCANAPLFAFGASGPIQSPSGSSHVPPGYMEAVNASKAEKALLGESSGKSSLSPLLVPVEEFGDPVAVIRQGETFGDLALLSSSSSSTWHDRRKATIIVTESGEPGEDSASTPSSSSSESSAPSEHGASSSMSRELQQYTAMLRKMRMAGAAKAMKAVASVLKFAGSLSPPGSPSMSGEGVT